MTHPTHKVFAVAWALAANMILSYNGMTQINYYLAMLIILPVAKSGALFPDVDHHWASVKEKTAINWVINKLIHVTGGKHRSWQTHSLDIAVMSLLVSFSLPGVLLERGVLTIINKEVLSVIMLGFCAGWFSHLFSDMLTSAGVRVFFWNNKKVALVPRKIGSFRFNTGNEWEQFVYTFTRIINIIVGLFALVFPFICTPEGIATISKLFNM